MDDVEEVLFNLQLTREEVSEEAAAEAEAEPEVVKKGKLTDEDEE